ncbi:hypothetical protein O181_016599 [Austropuccinia psidii MF-1]|uniref:Tf2-1-like SH3-like domain-containing protein n=1 Tax=Austropuccinia psidii MF-1 TaxID=1389203 RepID=A0A9Q3C474_9BASI|nr:hypothetical protein [Austropuccinia psidii MF-1]
MNASYRKVDWHTWLPMSEFAYNTSDHSSTKKSPFATIYGTDPHFDLVQTTQVTPPFKLSTKIQSVQQDFKRELEVSKKRFKRYADKIKVSQPVLNPCEVVRIFSKNIKSTRTTNKLSERWLGPFPILKKVSTNAYQLKLSHQ